MVRASDQGAVLARTPIPSINDNLLELTTREHCSIAEITAHSRQQFVVTEATPFEPADNDKPFRLRSTKTTWSNGFESTFIAAPAELPMNMVRTVDASKTLPLFLGGLMVMATASVGIVLRQQMSSR